MVAASSLCTSTSSARGYLKIQVPFYLELFEVLGARELAGWFKEEYRKLGRDVGVWAGGLAGAQGRVIRCTRRPERVRMHRASV